jgi:hypothetical protein
LKIYLLLIDHSRFFFYSDESEALHNPDDADGPSRPRAGARAWLYAQFAKFRSAWEHADSGALLWMRRAWEWLHTWTHPDEAMLARLWSARCVELHHPAARTQDEVHAIWTDYLKNQWWRHLVWLIVNGTIAPFTVLLFPLPGPNLIGYWFAYRAVHHTLVVWGIRRVLRKSTPTELHPVAALDLAIERDGDGNVGHSALTGSATGLADHVNWHSRSRGASVETKLPSGPRPASQNPPVTSLRLPETGDHAPIEL